MGKPRKHSAPQLCLGSPLLCQFFPNTPASPSPNHSPQQEQNIDDSFVFFKSCQEKHRKVKYTEGFKSLATELLFLNFSTHTQTQKKIHFEAKGSRMLTLSRSHQILKPFQQVDLYSKGPEVYLRAVYFSAGPFEAKA